MQTPKLNVVLDLSPPRRSQIRRLADYIDSLEGSAVPLYGTARDEFLERVKRELVAKGCEGALVSRGMGHNLHITFSVRLTTQ